MLLYIISGWEELSIDHTGAICFCGLLYKGFMHFHSPSFLLGLLRGIILIVLLIYLVLSWSVKEDERLCTASKAKYLYLKDLSKFVLQFCSCEDHELILTRANGALRVWAGPVGPTASVAGVRAGLGFCRIHG